MATEIKFYKHNCKRCGYGTDRISNLKDHLNRKKPCKRKEPESTPEEPPQNVHNVHNIHDFSQNECAYCKKKLSRIDSLKRHMLVCKKKPGEGQEDIEKHNMQLVIQNMQKEVDDLKRGMQKEVDDLKRAISFFM